MPRVSSGKRYAQAAFELAMESGKLEDWQVGLSRIVDVTGNEKLMTLMENPKLPFAAKRELMKEGLGEVNPLVLNLAYLLASRGMLRRAESISQEYDRLLDAYRGIEHAVVVTAVTLDDDEKEEFSRQLGEMVGRKVVVEVQTDPSVLGGFRAKVGDTLIDGSTRNKLESLRKSLVVTGR
jgi:F-type H+-transporting ATPase subunit delta